MPDNNANTYAGKTLLCYAYPVNGGHRVYPQYVITQGGLEKINDALRVFPPCGAIFIPERSKYYCGFVKIQYDKKGLARNRYYDNVDVFNIRYDLYVGNIWDDRVTVINCEYDDEYVCVDSRLEVSVLRSKLEFFYDDGDHKLISDSGKNMYVECSDHKIVGPFDYVYQNRKIKLTGSKDEEYFTNVYGLNDLHLARLYTVGQDPNDRGNVINCIAKSEIENATREEQLDLLDGVTRIVVRNPSVAKRIVRLLVCDTPEIFSELVFESPEIKKELGRILGDVGHPELEMQIARLKRELSDARQQLGAAKTEAEELKANAEAAEDKRQEKLRIEEEMQELLSKKENIFKEIESLKKERNNAAGKLLTIKNRLEGIVKSQSAILEDIKGIYDEFPTNCQEVMQIGINERSVLRRVEQKPRCQVIDHEGRTLRYWETLVGVPFDANPQDGCNYNISQTVQDGGLCACDIPCWKLDGFSENFRDPYWYIDTFINNERRTWRCRVSSLINYAKNALCDEKYKLYFDYRRGIAYTTPNATRRLWVQFECVWPYETEK